MLDCNTCDRRHDASAEGFCTEFTAMPQIDRCGMHLSSSKVIPVVHVVNKPTGEYLHLSEKSYF